VKLEAYYNNKRFSYTVLFDNGIREKNSNYSEDKEVHEQIAEEARILYVALTRAIRNCIWINNIDCVPDISWGTLLEGVEPVLSDKDKTGPVLESSDNQFVY